MCAAIGIHQFAAIFWATAADEVHPQPSRARHVARVPERRVWPLSRGQLDRHTIELKVLPMVGYGVTRQPLEKDLQCLVEPRLRFRRAMTPEVVFDGGDTPADAHLQAAIRQVIDHADLFDEPQRVVKGQQVDQCPKFQALRVLRRGGKEH